jgi:hypothetical protein
MAFGLVTNTYAYDPTAALRNLYGAPYAVVSVFEVKDGMEPEFLDAMVKAGPYDKLLAGFANERILQPLPATRGNGVAYSCVDRYYDLATAEFIEKQRTAAVRQFLKREPTRLNVKLIEHWLGNWGWERGTAASFLRVEPFKNDEIFQKNLSSLSFFKAGYVGQIGMLELFPKGTTLEQIRSEIQSHPGLSGASVFSATNGGQYVCYCEFFKSPAHADKHTFDVSPTSEVITGAQAGMVVQNYVPR